MKLRLRNNSIRLRLTQGEVAQFGKTGRVDEMIQFSDTMYFYYVLEKSPHVAELQAKLENSRITVMVPHDIADRWVNSTDVGMENDWPIGSDSLTLRILVEKDFACLTERAGEDDSDAFPNPNQTC